MGWSCAKKAMDSLEKIKKALVLDEEGPSNVFKIYGTNYLLEISTREHYDGAISGEIFNLDNWIGRPCNRFKINGNGNLQRGPAYFKKAIEGEYIVGLEKQDYH